MGGAEMGRTGMGRTGMSPGPRVRRLRARDGLLLAAREWPGPEDSGDRPPVLCLPGISRNARDFTAVAERLAERRRVVALDHAGHGDSEYAEDPARYAFPRALSDVLDAMAALHLHRVAIIGTSFGGVLAMALGVVRPGCLAAVVLNDVGPRIEASGLNGAAEIIGSDPAAASLAAAADWLRPRLPPLGIADQAGWLEMADATYAEGPDGCWHPRWDLRLAGLLRAGAGATQLWPLFGGLASVPLMLIWGQESTVLAPATVQRMRRERPDMDFLTLPGIGHAPLLAEPRSLDAIERFLDGAA
jgi:pimeloyl-ACP methyl ester carboxylesterase